MKLFDKVTGVEYAINQSDWFVIEYHKHTGKPLREGRVWWTDEAYYEYSTPESEVCFLRPLTYEEKIVVKKLDKKIGVRVKYAKKQGIEVRYVKWWYRLFSYAY